MAYKVFIVLRKEYHVISCPPPFFFVFFFGLYTTNNIPLTHSPIRQISSQTYDISLIYEPLLWLLSNSIYIYIYLHPSITTANILISLPSSSSSSSPLKKVTAISTRYQLQHARTYALMEPNINNFHIHTYIHTYIPLPL